MQSHLCIEQESTSVCCFSERIWMFEKVRVYLKDWNAKPKRAKRVPHVAFQESAYRALLKDNGAVSLDRRGAMEKFHFNAVQQVVGLCQGGKRKKNNTLKKHMRNSAWYVAAFWVFLVTLAVPSSEIQCSMTGLKKRKFTSMRHTVMGRRDSCLVVRRWTSRAGNPEMDESMWTLRGKTRNDWFNRMKFDIFSSVSCAANFGLEVSLDLMKFDSLIVPKRCQTQSKRFFFERQILVTLWCRLWCWGSFHDAEWPSKSRKWKLRKGH